MSSPRIDSVYVPIERLDVGAYTVPTDAPESDGTLEWNSTTIVIVQAHGGGRVGLGYSYTHASVARLVSDVLEPVVRGVDAMNIPDAWERMRRSIRNLGRPGLASTALAAVDTALWDLKARLLDLPLVGLLGRVRESIPVYGSGGFTSYSVDRLREQLGAWAASGFRFVKMKVGRDPVADLGRVRAAREAIGEHVELFVDANGAFERRAALDFAHAIAPNGVTYFEEPVTSDDLDGLRLIRDRAPPAMSIAAGEYGYDLPYFRRMLDAGAVDVLQADVTRCGGITELLNIGALCAARSLPLSGHTAPALHTHVACAIPAMRHLEWFHDHVRIERMFFDGFPEPETGELRPDPSRPGMGLELRKADAAPFADEARGFGR